MDFLAVEKPSGYTVRVLPNVSAADDFVFYVDGAPHLFSKILDLSVAFDIDGQGDYFIMSVDKSMSEVLQSLYSDSEVVMSSVLTAAHLYFLLEVIPDNGASVVYIEFNNVVPVQSVILDINQINF
ncbi:MAG: hypothetical protein LBP62_02970 [Clostridiales bacterium]|nr:hypothetical protein [Clostridiales bacterium]